MQTILGFPVHQSNNLPLALKPMSTGLLLNNPYSKFMYHIHLLSLYASNQGYPLSPKLVMKEDSVLTVSIVQLLAPLIYIPMLA